MQVQLVINHTNTYQHLISVLSFLNEKPWQTISKFHSYLCVDLRQKNSPRLNHLKQFKIFLQDFDLLRLLMCQEFKFVYVKLFQVLMKKSHFDQKVNFHSWMYYGYFGLRIEGFDDCRNTSFCNKNGNSFFNFWISPKSAIVTLFSTFYNINMFIDM